MTTECEHDWEDIGSQGGVAYQGCRMCGWCRPACTCTQPPYGDGPEIDCPLHGVVCVCGKPLGLHPPGELHRIGDKWAVEGCESSVLEEEAE